MFAMEVEFQELLKTKKRELPSTGSFIIVKTFLQQR